MIIIHIPELIFHLASLKTSVESERVSAGFGNASLCRRTLDT